MKEELEKYRVPHPLGCPHKKGDDFGWFEIPGPNGKTLRCMASPMTGNDWYHVSISLKNRCPNWPEMCFVKSLFFAETDTVVQYHPAKADYVNMAENCLHLWKWNKGEFPKPDPILIGWV